MTVLSIVTGEAIRTFKGHSDSVDSVAFSFAGRRILSSGIAAIKLWDVATGEEIRTIEDRDYCRIAFSPNGCLALSQTIYGTNKLWDVATGEAIRTFKRDFVCVSFSPDNRLALSGTMDEVIDIWDVATGKEIRTLKGHPDVTTVTFSPDGCMALSGSWDRTIRLWNITTGEELRIFKGHTSPVISVVFSPDGRLVLSGSRDKSIRLWNVATGKEIVRVYSFDNDEWITMTPEGYYTASKNAEQFIRFRIGNEIHGIEKYRLKYHQPDIVRKALRHL